VEPAPHAARISPSTASVGRTTTFFMMLPERSAVGLWMTAQLVHNDARDPEGSGEAGYLIELKTDAKG
jgi:hypothetical protein